MNKSYIVDHSYEGIRIDKWIRNNLGNVPQGLIEKSLRAGKIKLNNKKIKSSTKLNVKDIINVYDIKYEEIIIQKKIFWDKIFKPFSTVIMLFLSMPFIFGRHRSSNPSQRIVVGVFIGIAFFIISSILPNLGMVLGIVPIVSILLPNLFFIMVGKYLLDYQLEASLR